MALTGTASCAGRVLLSFSSSARLLANHSKRKARSCSAERAFLPSL